MFFPLVSIRTINYFVLVQFQMTPDLSHVYTKNEIEGLAPSTGTTTDVERCRDLCIHRMELIPSDMTCKYRFKVYSYLRSSALVRK